LFSLTIGVCIFYENNIFPLYQLSLLKTFKLLSKFTIFDLVSSFILPPKIHSYFPWGTILSLQKRQSLSLPALGGSMKIYSPIIEKCCYEALTHGL